MLSQCEQVNIVIPIYEGLTTTVDCINSVLESNIGHASITIINDASPNDALIQAVSKICRNHHIRLISNMRNQGFVVSVNLGMKIEPLKDVLLLNSDTLVCAQWLIKLRHIAYQRKNIGTVTPFSNNATICSYPEFCQDNPLPEKISLQHMDRACQKANSGKYINLPTAVGFCMYIKRHCIDSVGYFDEQRFGKGYGEENEFCMRSSAEHWQHVLGADTFVYHKGGVSFKNNQQAHHQAEGEKALLKLYPNYHRQIADFISKDPIAPYRKNISQALSEMQ